MVLVLGKLARLWWAFLRLEFIYPFCYNKHMTTIKQLIAALQAYDPDLPIMLPGYEGGVYSPQPKLHQATIALEVNQEWYYGPHEVVDVEDPYQQEQYSQFKQTKAVILR